MKTRTLIIAGIGGAAMVTGIVWWLRRKSATVAAKPLVTAPMITPTGAQSPSNPITAAAAQSAANLATALQAAGLTPSK